MVMNAPHGPLSGATVDSSEAEVFRDDGVAGGTPSSTLFTTAPFSVTTNSITTLPKDNRYASATLPLPLRLFFPSGSNGGGCCCVGEPPPPTLPDEEMLPRWFFDSPRCEDRGSCDRISMRVCLAATKDMESLLG